MKGMITARHFVKNEGSLEKLRQKIDDLNNAEEFKKFLRDSDAYFMLSASFPSEQDYADDVSKSVAALDSGDQSKRYAIEIAADKSMNRKVEQSLVSPVLKTTHWYCLYDLDQFVVNNREAVDAFKSIVERTIKDGYLIGIGARDVRVRLGIDKKADEIRQVQELCHSIYGLFNVNRLYTNRPGNVSEAYHEFGDLTPGFYIVNHVHKGFENLAKESDRQQESGNLGSNAREYHLVLRGGELGKVAMDYVRAEENPFYEELAPDEEIRKAEGYVSTLTKNLYKTGVFRNNNQRNFLQSEYPAKELSNYFDKELVKHAIGIMRRAASE